MHLAHQVLPDLPMLISSTTGGSASTLSSSPSASGFGSSSSPTLTLTTVISPSPQPSDITDPSSSPDDSFKSGAITDLSPWTSNSGKAAVIGSTTSLIVVLLCLSLGALIAKIKQRRQHTLAVQGDKKEGRSLLDREDFDDEDLIPMSSYRDHTSVPHTVSPASSLLNAHTPDNDPIKRAEVEPFAGVIGPIAEQSSHIDFSGIIDNIMGSSASTSGSPLAPDQELSGSKSTERIGPASTLHRGDLSVTNVASHLQQSTTTASHNTTPPSSPLSEADAAHPTPTMSQ